MLRTAPISRSGGTSQDIKRDFSKSQLAGIGAVTVAWNEIEFLLDVALYSGEALTADCLLEDLPARFLDGKIKQLRKAKDRWKLPIHCLESIERSINAFSYLKDLRNAVIHSRLFDARTAICHRVTRKGEIQEVLLTAEALDWLYHQLMILHQEMTCVIAIFDLVRTTEIAEQIGLVKPGQIDPIPEVQAWLSKLDQSCKDRENLGDAPDFPPSNN